MALSADTNHKLTGGEADAALRLQASETPYAGSVLALAADGFAEPNDSSTIGQPFAGIAQQRVESKDHPSPAADGDLNISARRGLFFAELTITGVAQDDVAHGRLVFASDDGTFSFTPSGTLVGRVWEYVTTNRAIVLCATAGHQGALGYAVSGVKTLDATGAQTLTTADLGKLILITNTAAQTITLPAAADCTGRSITFKKTSADAEIATLDGAGSETIDGATTSTVMDAANDTLTILSTGAAWVITSYKIA